MTIEMGKQYEYRCGKPARILCVDKAGDRPIVSCDPDGIVMCHYANGQIVDYGEGGFDLVEPPVRIKQTFFIGVYYSADRKRPYVSSILCETEHYCRELAAQAGASVWAIQRIDLDLVQGEGL